ncbi:MAG: ATP-dependent Clp protease ATP-binding subunit [Planctomycetes bacterium]|nr:ATP-dependent Clp protease ATP-binding subunit [Planctomycetota bacterium]
MIRLEPSMVMKYVDGLDAFVKFRIYSRDALLHVLHETRITDRRSYVNMVLETCVAQLPAPAKTALETGGENREALREVLFEMCVGLNPELDIHRVTLPVPEEPRPEAETEEAPAAEPAYSGRRLDPADLASALRSKVIGQDEAVDAVAAAVTRAQSGLRDTERPVGVFLFLGQTGVGKTELAKALAEELSHGDRKALVRIDCSEYSLPHEYAKLIGAPPGYVGHEQGGYLTSVMSEANATVVLFDEIEKADEKVHNLLLQIMDEGFVTDAKGVKIDFTESILILTSNIGAGEAEALQRRLGFGMVDRKALGHDERKSASQEALRKKFRPEFLNRIDEMICFRGLGKPEATLILDKFVGKLAERTQRQGFHLDLTAEAKDWLLSKGFSDEFGAREMRRCVQRHLEAPLADAIVTSKLNARGTLTASVAENALKFQSSPVREATRGKPRAARAHRKVLKSA